MRHLTKAGAACLSAALLWLIAGCAANPPCADCDYGVGASAENRPARIQTRYQAVHQADCAKPVPVHAIDAGTHVRHGFMHAAASTARLHLLKGNTQARRVVILVGGIHDNYHYFDNWVPLLASMETLVIGWDHDYRSMTLAGSANLLAQDLARLHQAGIVDVTLVAHSIGGLVTKGAIDGLTRNRQAHAFQRLDLHAFGTPWGGFAIVGMVLKVPGSATMSVALGYPMATELKPGSNYLNSLSKPMPANGRLHLYAGNADHVALPVRSVTRRRYALIEANAASVTTIDGFLHNDYSKSTTLAGMVRQLGARTGCLEAACAQMPVMDAGLLCGSKLPVVAQRGAGD